MTKILALLITLLLFNTQFHAQSQEAKIIFALIDGGEAALALEKAEGLVKGDEDLAENYYVRGRAYLAMKDASKALKDFKKADSLKLATAELYFYEGTTLALLAGA
jgi:tetratricopeptide (TPR) repeat protein